jgi:ADP-ribose pyrophosphatase YjhB (NUDIX family)
MIQAVRRAWKPVIRPLLRVYWRLARGITLGVRGMVINAAGEVLLVEHSYAPGWHLPGGGVEPGETVRDALARELAEEGNVTLVGQPPLYAVYLNTSMSHRDHVALFVVREFRQESPPRRNREIIAHGFFAPGGLPPDTAAGTRRRIAEVLGGASTSEQW